MFRSRFHAARYFDARYFNGDDAAGGGATDNLYRKAFGSMNRMMTP